MVVLSGPVVHRAIPVVRPAAEPIISRHAGTAVVSAAAAVTRVVVSVVAVPAIRAAATRAAVLRAAPQVAALARLNPVANLPAASHVRFAAAK